MSESSRKLFGEMEIICPECRDEHGRGWHCQRCNGEGVVLTEAGEALMEFISRHSERYL